MHGLMMQWPLTVDRILDHAARWHGEREVVSRTMEGSIERTSYARVRERAQRLSNALLDMGVRPGDRVATLAWNGYRHLETWYATMGIGAVCHTLNPRLFADQLCYIVNHAADRVLFTDLTFVPFVVANLTRMPTIERVVVMTDAAGMIDCPRAVDYESLIAPYPAQCSWGNFHEETACGLCYTSGTTGHPKGVLYSHRSNFLHTLMTLQTDVFGLSARDVVLPIVPMFHANAWGLAFAAPAAGAKLVLPGQRLDGAALVELIEEERVTFAAAVPTVWQTLLAHLDESGQRLTTLRRAAVGGSACPEVLIRRFHDQHGIEIVHLWGMTELSPVGTVGAMPPHLASLTFDEQLPSRLKQGRPPLGVDCQIEDDDGQILPHDGRTPGRLKVRGPAVAAAYLGGSPGDELDARGFFDTGDVATIDAMGFMHITDRAKDIIKSGGEWISSIEIENIAVGHPDVAIAAVIGLPHEKWGERPLLVIQPRPGTYPSVISIFGFLVGKIAKWWMPDEIRFIPDIPVGATGKIDKKLLRERFRGSTLA